MYKNVIISRFACIIIITIIIITQKLKYWLVCAIYIVFKVNILQQGSLALTHAYNYKRLVDLFRKLFVCIRPPNVKTNLIDPPKNYATKPSSAFASYRLFGTKEDYIVCKIMCDWLITISRSIAYLICQNNNARQIVDQLMYNIHGFAREYFISYHFIICSHFTQLPMQCRNIILRVLNKSI